MYGSSYKTEHGAKTLFYKEPREGNYLTFKAEFNSQLYLWPCFL
jgi:hypothetical protein